MSEAEALADMGVEMIEQPVPVGADALLDPVYAPIPFLADESCQTAADVARIGEILLATALNPNAAPTHRRHRDRDLVEAEIADRAADRGEDAGDVEGPPQQRERHEDYLRQPVPQDIIVPQVY